MHNEDLTKIGVVVIGRNEGLRLKNCLESLLKFNLKIVYVDSGSTDSSIEFASSLGVDIVNLDLTTPFTAARARNHGFYKLVELHDDITYVQFVDGDCEVVPSWLPKAVNFLNNYPDVAIVCGRRRERNPEFSIFNYQCDLEWDTPIGESKSCGGDFLCRAKVFTMVGGFNPELIAGEEPELCVRVRKGGWKIHRLDEEMTLHDAAITHFRQWWKRSVRTGYAFSNGCYLHGNYPEYHWLRETKRSIFWGGVLPLLIIASLLLNGYMSLILFSFYPIQVARLAFRFSHTKKPWHISCLLVLSKFAEFIGVITFWNNLISNKKGVLIEYK